MRAFLKTDVILSSNLWSELCQTCPSEVKPFQIREQMHCNGSLLKSKTVVYGFSSSSNAVKAGYRHVLNKIVDSRYASLQSSSLKIFEQLIFCIKFRVSFKEVGQSRRGRNNPEVRIELSKQVSQIFRYEPNNT